MAALRCWLVRFWSVIRKGAGLGEEHTEGILSHRRHCAGCQGEAELESSVVRRLRAEAADQQREPSPYLRSKIMGAVRRSAVPVARRRFGISGWAFGLATGCALLAVLVFLQNRPRMVEESDPATVVVPIRAPFPLPTGAMSDLAIINEERLEKWGRSFDQPLQNEIQFVLNDARGVLENLAHNFLPSRLRESALIEIAN